MIIKNEDMLEESTPLTFMDGTAVYSKLADTFKTHEKGYFIIAPSGAGKTYFIDHQAEMNWIDGDTLWMASNAHPKGEWWNKSLDQINEIERRSDVITEQAKRLGFRIIGTDCYGILPDAIVLPDWEIHRRYILGRQNNSYDGGATSAQFDNVLKARKYMESIAKKSVPVFRSVDEAVEYLETL